MPGYRSRALKLIIFIIVIIKPVIRIGVHICEWVIGYVDYITICIYEVIGNLQCLRDRRINICIQEGHLYHRWPQIMPWLYCYGHGKN